VTTPHSTDSAITNSDDIDSDPRDDRTRRTNAPGESLQLTLNARWSDGTTTDVTAQATWQTSNARTLTVTSSGLLTGVANGEGSVSGRYSGMSRSRSLLVLPTGTFRLRGR
jgi:hypothetical protein